MTTKHQKLATAFDAATEYNQAARVQQKSAHRLATYIASLYTSRPHPTHILELGCGTGALTVHLHALFPQARLTALDLSPQMIERAKKAVPAAQYHVMNAEDPMLDGPYDLICSNFCAQWFTNRATAFRRLMHLLRPGGRLALTTLAHGSFSEWRTACTSVGALCGFPDYPTLAELEREWPAQAQGHWTIETLHDPVHSAYAFLHDLKTIGATTPKEGSLPHSPKTLRQIMRNFDKTTRTMRYQVALGSARRARGLFVTGTDTGIGKTLVSAILTKAMQATYWKPFQTGLAEEAGDAAYVKTLAALTPDEIIPTAYAFQAPLSPEAAAHLEGKEISLESLSLPETTAPLVVEGAGGVMVPLNDTTLLIDWIATLDLPIVLVAHSGLGTINHTLLSLEALKRRALPIAGIILNGVPNPDNRKALERFGQVPILAEIPHLATISPETIAQEADKLTEMLHNLGL